MNTILTHYLLFLFYTYNVVQNDVFRKRFRIAVWCFKVETRITKIKENNIFEA